MTDSEHELLARIDERTRLLQKEFEEFKTALTSKYVTHAEFRPVKFLVFGFVGLTLTSVVGALLTMVLRTQ